MRDRLLAQLDHLDSKLDNLLEVLNPFPEEELARKPGPEVWSPTQLICHLRLAEDISVGYVRKKLSFDPTLKKTGISHTVRSKINTIVLGFPIKIKAPLGAAEQSFPVEITYAGEVEKWKKLRAETRSYLTELDEKWLDKDVYKHPFAGRLSFGQMLTFFDGHMQRHTKQIMARLPGSV